MNEEIKVGTEVWFVSNDRLLHGVVSEVYRNFVVIPAEGSEYIIRKGYFELSRQMCLSRCDKGLDDLIDAEKRLKKLSE